MAISGYQPEDGDLADINVTPLVDVVLVLLVIFMVTAPAIAKRGLAFQEPQTVSGTRVPTSLEVTIDQERAIFVDGRPARDLGDVQDQVTAAVAANPELKALITADVRVPHGDVMALIDAIQLAGVKKFAFASKLKKPAKAGGD